MKDLLDILCCPKCRSELIKRNDSVLCSNIGCYYSNTPFLKVNRKLILVNFDSSIIKQDTIINSNASSLVRRTIKFSGLSMFTKRVLSGSNKVSSNNFETCSELLNKIETPKILIVGGGTIGAGSHDIVDNFSNGIISFDIYYSDNIDFIADAHSIPLKNETIDLVIIQAVLEHVIYPNIVVNECHRVLKVGGYIYAETPFLQHVHEGAYDFTRYTVLGHRILFEQFDEFKSGFIGGLGQSLLWSIDFFVSGVFRNRVAGKIVKGCFFWLRWIEKVIPNSWNIDGACGSYFIGQKTTNKHKIKLNNVLIQYKGAQQ